MNLVDSSGWLEYFAGTDRAAFFVEAIEDTEHLVVPVICIYEVFKKILQSRGQAIAEIHVADMLKGNVVDLNSSVAMNAALLAVKYRLPMADSFILAIAYDQKATLWTQDQHFASIEGVKYYPKD